MSAPRRILVMGSLNLDLVVTLPAFPRPGQTVTGETLARFPGGKGANQAFAAARLGGKVALLGRIGREGEGTWLKEHLAAAGVDVGAVEVDDEAPSGTALILVDGAGQNQIVVIPGANATLDLPAARRWESAFASAEILLLQLEVPLAATAWAAHQARGRGATVILDPAPAQPLPDELFAAVDYLTPNETELAALDDREAEGPWPMDRVIAAARRLRARGARRVVVKLGERGALLSTEDDERLVPPFPVTAVDTTAAGDTFNAAFAVALAEGRPPAQAVRFANAAAALSVTRLGAQPSMPSREPVERLLAQRGDHF